LPLTIVFAASPSRLKVGVAVVFAPLARQKTGPAVNAVKAGEKVAVIALTVPPAVADICAPFCVPSTACGLMECDGVLIQP